MASVTIGVTPAIALSSVMSINTLPRISLGTSLAAVEGTELFLGTINLLPSGFTQLRLTPNSTSSPSPQSPGPEFSNQMETQGTITLVSSAGNSLVIAGIGDSSEPYQWNATNVTEISDYLVHVSGLTDQSLSITFDDGVAISGRLSGDSIAGTPEATARVRVIIPPMVRIRALSSMGVPDATAVIRSSQLTLSDLRTPGEVREAAALLVASDDALPVVGTIYADSDIGGSDIPLDGELGLGVGETVLSRIRRTLSSGINRLSIVHRSNPVFLHIGDYFSSGGEGNDLTITIQTVAGAVRFTVADSLLTSGGNFVHFELSTDAQAIVDAITIGDRFIVAFTRPEPGTPARLGAESIAGTPEATARVRVIIPQQVRLGGEASVGVPVAGLRVRNYLPTHAEISATSNAGTPSAFLRVQVLPPRDAYLRATSRAGFPSAFARSRTVGVAIVLPSVPGHWYDRKETTAANYNLGLLQYGTKPAQGNSGTWWFNKVNRTIEVDTGSTYLVILLAGAAANVPSLRTLGTGSMQAAAGNHTH